MPIFILNVKEVYKNRGEIEIEADTREEAIEKYMKLDTEDSLDRGTAELTDWEVLSIKEQE